MGARGLLAQIMSHRPGWRITLASLADTNNVGAQAIRTMMNELMTAGYIERSADRERGERGRLGDYTYITKDPHSPDDVSPTLAEPTLVKPHTKNNILKEQHLKENKERTISPAELDELWSKFWEIYPRHSATSAARRSFAKAYKKAGDAVIEGARRFATDPNLPPKQFIPHASTWLNQGRWDDEPLPARQMSKEERETYERQQLQIRKDREREASLRLLEEARRAEAEAKANPAPRCEHDRVIYLCTACYKPDVTETH